MSNYLAPSRVTAAAVLLVTVAGHASSTVAAGTRVGNLPDDQQLSLTVALRPRSPTALAEAVALSQPRRRPTVAELGLAVGQPQTNVDAIADYFRERGLTVLPLAADHLSFKVTGSVAAIQTALTVSFGTYQDRAGRRYYSTDGDPYLPADLAALVQAIYGLDNYPVRRGRVQLLRAWRRAEPGGVG